MKQGARLFKELTWLTQLGISLITPPLVLTWLCYWLNSRFAVGTWLIVVGLIVGLLVSVSTALSFYRRATRKPKDEQKPTGFNSHD